MTAIVLPKLTAKARKRVCITIYVTKEDRIISGMHSSAEESLEYFRSCIDTILKMGYFPRIDYMPDMFDGISGWAFISWDVQSVPGAAAPELKYR